MTEGNKGKTPEENLKWYLNHCLSVLGEQKKGELSGEAYYELCNTALELDGYLLLAVCAENLSSDRYASLCVTAVRQNGMALELVFTDIEIEPYHTICLEAVKQNGLALYFVYKEAFKNYPEKLEAIYSRAVCNNADALQFIERPAMALCLNAVKKHAGALRWINPQGFSKEDYGKICFTAFYRKQARLLLERIFGEPANIKPVQDSQALRWVDKNHCTEEEYRVICCHAIKYSSNNLRFVDTSLWDDRGFCQKAAEISEKAKDFLRKR